MTCRQQADTAGGLLGRQTAFAEWPDRHIIAQVKRAMIKERLKRGKKCLYFEPKRDKTMLFCFSAILGTNPNNIGHTRQTR